MPLQPQGIAGPWKSGFVLDWHTIESACTGENELGYPLFETRRSDIGELLFRLKYRNDLTALTPLAECAAHYLGKVRERFDVVAPVPPSKQEREIKPTVELAREIGRLLQLPVACTALVRVHSIRSIKTFPRTDLTRDISRDTFGADARLIAGQSLLLIGDLYRTGATLATATQVAYEQGRARDVYAFAIARTRAAS